MSRWLQSHRQIFDEIMALDVGVAQSANADLMKLLASICDLEILRFSSGQEFNGWVIPDSCSVLKAEIRNGDKVLFDGTRHPLALIANSGSFVGTLQKKDLDKHVYSSTQCPDAFPFHCTNNYRPWETQWGFCIPEVEYRMWPEGEYEVDIQTEFNKGEMLVGVCELQGESDSVIVFNAHVCHPCQFEDGFSGVAAILEVMERLSQLPSRRYTYRAIFAPEHIGTVFYLQSLSPVERARIKGAIFTEMIGLDHPFAIQKTFTGIHALDRIAVAEALAAEPQTRVGDFRTIVGNDETVWEAPGYEIPCISISRCFESPHYYPEYHTSADTIDRSHFGRREAAVDLIERIVLVLERDMRPTRRFEGLVALSNPQYNLYVQRPDPTVPHELSEIQLRLGEAQDRLLRMLDGSLTVFEVSELLQLPFDVVLEHLRKFAAKGLIFLEAPSPDEVMLGKSSLSM